MLFSSRFTLILLLAVSGWMATGCSSGPASSVPAPGFGHDRDVVTHRGTTTASEQDAIEAQAQYATALVHEMNGEADAATEAFHRAATRDPSNEALVLEVSRRLFQAKQTEKALELLRLAIAQPRPSANLFARLGFLHFQNGNVDQAIAANRTAIRRDPRALVSYQNLFLIYLQTNLTAEAVKVLDDAGKVPGVPTEFLIALGELYGTLGLQKPAEREGAFAKGIAVLKRALKEPPTEPHLRLRLADAFNTLGETTQSAGIYRELLGELDDMPFMRDSVRAKLMDVYLRGRNVKEAAEQLQDLIRDNPADIQAHYILGSIHYNETNYVAASESFSRVVVLNPEFEQAYYELAAAQLNAGQAGEALKTLERARAKFPQKFYAEYLTGVAYTSNDDFTNALKHFTTAEVIAEASGSAASILRDSFYFQLGATCERLGDYQRAEQYFEKCLELSPNNDEAQNYLGYMLAERGEKLDRAKALIERALVANPGNAAYLDSMGWVLFKLNQRQEALKYLLDAIKASEEEDATLYDHLGDVYDSLQQHDKAREAWTKSLSIEANDKVREKLSRGTSASSVP
ncbi:MAG TPA: tetratricopeptide repeat protein [Verrucomicrobiae bacterium]|nr:tetratricopeptide repeat protein [Verrucomicrobiae bacterium]